MKSENKIPDELVEKIAEERSRHVGSVERFYWPRWIQLEVIKYYESGLTLAELELRTGISGSVIYKWVRKFSQKKKRSTPAKASPAKFSQLQVSGISDSDSELRVRVGSSEIYGFTVKTLHEFLRESGQLSR
jgi:transposase